MIAPRTAPATAPQRSPSGLCRVHLSRDLPAIADLIEVAYQDELALTDSNIVERLRQLAAMSPLIRVVDRVAAVLDGYVWIQDGKLVGNITLGQGSSLPGAPIAGSWTISNVAVHPAYRGRGIAGRLVDAALLHLRAIGARCVLLQVRSNNAPAVALYRHRGFAVYETITELRLQNRWLRPAVVGTDPRVRPARARDITRVMQLARRNQPTLLRPLARIHPSDLGLALWQRLPRRVATWLGLPVPLVHVAHVSGRLVGYARLASVNARMLRLEIGVVPGQDQDLIQSLVTTALASARFAPWTHVVADVPTDLPEARAALEALGFESLREL
ncbi:MAG: GNAT family N-acetyltransferase, partial [Anaerolineae bacterium]